SDRDFAIAFFQIPPHDGHPWLSLTVPTDKPVSDFHRRVNARAAHTKKSGGNKQFPPDFLYKLCSRKGEMTFGEGKPSFHEKRGFPLPKPHPFREKRSIFCSRWLQKAYQIISPQWEYSETLKDKRLLQNLPKGEQQPFIYIQLVLL
ncbi:MAG: hypothetical protein IJY46_10875, partial [Lentisphaeria bacterium]|nr:hypothetical protein [Lentisphaeria bacterium]